MAEVKEEKSLRYSYPMNGGDGPKSYSQNSSYQEGVIEGAKELINETINSTEFDFKINNNTFKIVDLGCSVGPNTFFSVQNIIEAIKLKYNETQNPNQTHPEFHVFFNDHVDNDFNTLFKNIPPNDRYFAAGVPGSFHDRLFPKSSLHCVHISFSLHWLSEVPKEVLDPKSPAWNKDSIQCTGFVKEVAEAYADQYKRDLNKFLSARAEELVHGGLMFISGSVLPDGVLFGQVGMGMYFQLLGSCLTDLANQGVLTKEKVESFNLPLYYAQKGEFKKIVEENGCFSIEKMETFDPIMKIPLTLTPESITIKLRAVFEGIINQHFGNGIDDVVFEFCAEKLKGYQFNANGNKPKDKESFIVLKCKVE